MSATAALSLIPAMVSAKPHIVEASRSASIVRVTISSIPKKIRLITAPFGGPGRRILRRVAAGYAASNSLAPRGADVPGPAHDDAGDERADQHHAQHDQRHTPAVGRAVQRADAERAEPRRPGTPKPCDTVARWSVRCVVG